MFLCVTQELELVFLILTDIQSKVEGRKKKNPKLKTDKVSGLKSESK